MRENHETLSPPTPHASFDVREFARASERMYAATAFAADELPTTKRSIPDDAEVTGALPADARAETDEDDAEDTLDDGWVSLDDGTSLDIDRVPVLVSSRSDLAWLDLGSVAVHLVLRIDGETAVRALVAESGLPCATVAAALSDLVQRGIVAFG